MSHTRRQRTTAAVATIVALTVTPALTGCGSDEFDGTASSHGRTAPVTSQDQGQITVLDLDKADIQPDTKEDVRYVNQWLRNNPNRRVVALTEIKQNRDSIRSYVIYWVPGSNADQHFQSIWFGSDNDSSGSKFAAELKKWQSAHPDKRIVALAAMPSPWAGIDTGRLLYEDAK